MPLFFPVPAHAVGVIVSSGLGFGGFSPFYGGFSPFGFGGFGGFGYPMMGPTVVLGPGSGFGPILLFFFLPVLF